MSTSATLAVPSNQYFRSIDGLRILAAANIVLFHLYQSGGLNDLGGRPAVLFTIIKGPMFHASLFFILAGFIYTIKYAAHAASFSTPRFFWSRFRALYPLHVAATLAMVPLIIIKSAPGEIPWGKLGVSVAMHLGGLWPFYPLDTFNLNTPSWALSAFFFCYLLFGPVLKLVIKLEHRRWVFGAIALALIPSILWTVVFASLDFAPRLYQFFHVFPPVRFFEFVLGMLLARLYQVSTYKTGGKGPLNRPAFNDLAILGILGSLFAAVALRPANNLFIYWTTYHVAVLPLFALLLYRFARGNGAIPGLTAQPTIRLLGQCSFYPYLLHIPLSSWICFTLEQGFGYRTFLHHPLNVALFIIALYGLSAWYWSARGKKKRRAHSMAGKVA